MRSRVSTLPGRAAGRRGLSDLPRDRLVDLGRRASAEVRLDLEAVVGARVVARRDRDAAREAEPPHVVGDGGRRESGGPRGGRRRRSRARASRAPPRRTRGRGSACRGRRRLGASRPAVSVRSPATRSPRRRRDRVEGAVFREEAAPAVRSEGEAQGVGDAGPPPRAGESAASRSSVMPIAVEEVGGAREPEAAARRARREAAERAERPDPRGRCRGAAG